LKKGYIGAIGDDLPAIFPLLMGLVLFFSAFNLTYDDYNLKNTELRIFRASIEIASVLEGDGGVTANSFDERCRDAALLGIDYSSAFYAEILEAPSRIAPCGYPYDRNLEEELTYIKRVNSVVFPITVYETITDPRTGRQIQNTTIAMLRVRAWRLG
jgi:hypothetical protein